jgi:hypothetical protein
MVGLQSADQPCVPPVPPSGGRMLKPGEWASLTPSVLRYDLITQSATGCVEDLTPSDERSTKGLPSYSGSSHAVASACSCATFSGASSAGMVTRPVAVSSSRYSDGRRSGPHSDVNVAAAKPPQLPFSATLSPAMSPSSSQCSWTGEPVSPAASTTIVAAAGSTSVEVNATPCTGCLKPPGTTSHIVRRVVLDAEGERAGGQQLAIARAEQRVALGARPHHDSAVGLLARDAGLALRGHSAVVAHGKAGPACRPRQWARKSDD